MTKAFCDKCGKEVSSKEQNPFRFRQENIDVIVDAKLVDRNSIDHEWIFSEAVLCQNCVQSIISQGDTASRKHSYEGPIGGDREA